MKKTLGRIIGGRIKRFRREQKLNQEELALRSGLNHSYISIIERGDKCPTIETLYKVANGLNIPLYKLVDLYDEIDKKQQSTTDSFYEDKKITKFIEEVEDSLYTVYEADKVMDAIRLILEIAKGGL